MIEHACKNPVTGGLVTPLYQGDTNKKIPMYFCQYCRKRIRVVDGVQYISPVEKEVYAAEEERKLNEQKPTKARRKK